MLACLAVVPVLTIGYIRWQRASAARVEQLASSGVRMVGSAARAEWRRHLPAAVFIAAIAVLAFASARPEVTLALPQRTGTLVIAVDVSTSMSATDVEPTRLDVALDTARELIDELPGGVEVAVVAFGDGAQTVALLGSDRMEASAAVDRLVAGGGTSISAGLVTALQAITGEPLAVADTSDGEISADRQTAPLDLAAVDVDVVSAAQVVLLSDGEQTSEIDPLDAAELLASAGVPVDTVAIGTERGTVLDVDGFQVATALDAQQLEVLAEATNGRSYRADDAGAVDEIVGEVQLAWRTEGERTEITGLLAAAAAGLALISVGLSAWLLGRVI